MSRTSKIIGFVLVTLFGVYGCAKGPGEGTEKSTSPATKSQRLEEDLRAASAARDQLRQKLVAAEERQTQLQKQFETERAALKAELKARTTERDSVATQYDGFRKNLKELIGQAESALANPSGTISPATIGTAAPPMPSEAGTGQGN
jgi:hypothetical protein